MPFLIVSLLVCNWLGAELIDLQDLRQDFVLETKQILISGFNPTITRFNGELLLTYRVREGEDTSQNDYVWLNDALEVISTPKRLDIRFATPPNYFKMQDPRIVAVGDDYFIAFNNQIQMAPTKEIRRMFVAKLLLEGEELFTTDPEGLFNFQVREEQYQEKNWVPFCYNDELLLAYSLNPHTILKPLLGTGCSETICSTKKSISWDFGDLRGGTPALEVDGQYLAFFHSSKQMATVNSGGKSITHYFMGAYTFSKKPPFELTSLSPEPIVGDHFYYGKSYPTWKPLLVVFPCGFIHDENYIWVAYGRQDHEIWIVKLDKKGLLNSLKDLE